MFQTVMIADDSMPLHTLVKVQLKEQCLSFHSVYDGAAAVSAAASVRPDVILLDVDMPHMDGFEACRRIKADPNTASIPLIFLSADSFSADKTKGLELGAVDYIVKPFRPQELIARVRSTLQPVPVSTDSRLVDPLTGLWNNAFFEKHLKGQYSLSRNTGQPMACTVIEIDQLGTVGSTSGTKVANQIVRAVANVLSRGYGDESTVCCLPNQRFAILSSNTDRFAAAAMAESLRTTLEHNFAVNQGNASKITCSFGISDTLIVSADKLLTRAGLNTNRATNRGGNCISLARAPAKAGAVA